MDRIATLVDPAFEALPVVARNRSALSRIDYAADDLSTLRARLLERLPLALPGWNAALATQGGDYAVVFTELFAQLAAALNAYTDQRANESFLRTASLQGSLIDLCALVDYRLGSGASASVLQTFFAKPGKSGSLPAGFKLNAAPVVGTLNRSELVFETLQPLAVDASRNQMRLSGYNRSSRLLRLRRSADAVQDTEAWLDAAYAGLKAGTPIVFDDAASLTAVVLTAADEPDGATHLRWAAGGADRHSDLLIADLELLGRPKQAMRLAAAERADEITLGQTVLPVEHAAMFGVGAAVLVESGGLLMPALVLARSTVAGQASITLNRGVIASLRRSATRVLDTTHCGSSTGTQRTGSTSVVRDHQLHDPEPGDLLVIADAGGVELHTVASVDGQAIHLAQALTRALRPFVQAGERLARVRYYSVALNNPLARQSALRPMLLQELAPFANGQTVLSLDKSHDGLTPQTVVAFNDGTRAGALRVASVDTVEGKTVLTLDGSAPGVLRVATLGLFGPFEHRMRVAGHDHSESLLAAGASQLDIDGLPLGLAAGQDIVVADSAGAEGARITQVLPLPDRLAHTRISLARPLQRAHAIGDVLVYGNVTTATHGASASEEVLGSGDASAAPQRFALRRSPLAFLADAAAPRGVVPAVEVWIGDERWSLVDTLAGSAALDRHWAIEIDDRERAVVVFGDGVHGAVPPSGRNNIKVRYRTGHGLAANVASAAITKMPQPASWLERASNPISASGGAERETPAGARRQAPHRVRTLDRAVSLVDHTDLALTFAGIAKARATLEREGQGAAARRVIVVTVAAAGGGALGTPQMEALLAFLASRSSDGARVRVRGHRASPVRLALQVNVAPQFGQAAVQRALLAAFGSLTADDGSLGFFAFERRELGADLVLSAVYAAAEATEGVANVLATLFHAEGAEPGVADRIVVPDDALATGGDATDPAIGRFSVQVLGGLP